MLGSVAWKSRLLGHIEDKMPGNSMVYENKGMFSGTCIWKNKKLENYPPCLLPFIRDSVRKLSNMI